ncbi:terpene synthase family protein [Chitinophaga nivalis]|uniref:Terpene synthase n=1 Tax=Chitinophaga nivalis TaxID=2991709 RepID=A0ABT3IPT1_9BACT|nr:hypothetical protein [Chitinophaga nivalis]MCW3464509.1 hypothetical protein [Chitinophaga nivalis]MCW3485800.1 hypothetical protein [Chitinophaga nivalis]
MDLPITALLQEICPPKLHPLAADAEQQVQEWINAMTGLPPSFLEKYRHAAFGILTAGLYPQCTAAQLMMFSRYILWIFMHDDFFGPMPPAAIQASSEEAIRILRGASSLDHPIMQQLAILQQELVPYVDAAWQERFIQHMSDFFTSIAIERGYNYNPSLTYPSLDTYLALRLQSTASFTLIDLAQVAAAQLMPDALLHHPDISRLTILANKATGWTNDYFSFAKEENLETTNLIFVLQHTCQYSREEALAATIRQYNEVILEFKSVLNRLPDFGDQQSLVENYIQGLKWVISGHLNWYSYTKRYQMNPFSTTPHQ